MNSENSISEKKELKKQNFNKKNKKKFQPTFKKKVPVWKQIDQEINHLVPLYEEVKHYFY